MNTLSFIHCEKVKLLRSNIFWVVFTALVGMPMVLGIFAAFDNTAITWSAYLDEILGSITALLVVGFSFTAAWVFGREYTDNTISELIVKPVSKFSIVFSKFVVIFVWDILMALFAFVIIAVMGFIIGIDSGSSALLADSFIKFTTATLMLIAVSTVSALLANITKGYLVPIGVAFVIVVMSNIIVQIGVGAFFPWTIPSLFLAGGTLGFGSFLVVAITGVVGFVQTALWWRFAEQQ